MIFQQHKNVTTQEQEAEVENIADHATKGPRNNIGLQKEKSFLFQSDLNFPRVQIRTVVGSQPLLHSTSTHVVYNLSCSMIIWSFCVNQLSTAANWLLH